MTNTSNRLRGSTRKLDRVTVRFPEPMVDHLDQLVEQGIFPNRSEAIRAGIRHLNTSYSTVDDRR